MYGYSAYQKAARSTGGPRSTEHRLLGEVTAALMEAERIPQDRHKLVDAVLWNKKVWDHFVIELSDTDNQLPRETRASLTSIGIWVTRETYQVLDGESDLKSLIEINSIIMQGLR